MSNKIKSFFSKIFNKKYIDLGKWKLDNDNGLDNSNNNSSNDNINIDNKNIDNNGATNINKPKFKLKYIESEEKEITDLEDINIIDNIKNDINKYDTLEKNKKDLEDKIKYYEEFLNTHNLSHEEDKEMLNNIKNNLKNSKNELNKINEVNTNSYKNEKIKFYTQSINEIDKELSKIDEERNERINKLGSINLGLKEERLIDDKKQELLKIKRDCLEKKQKLLNEFKLEGQKIINNLMKIEKEENLKNSLNSEDLNNKKVTELRMDAKDNYIKNNSKMRKQELIDNLNHLNDIKKEYYENDNSMKMGYINTILISFITLFICVIIYITFKNI